MEERYDVPSELFGGSRGEGGIEIPGHREQRADDVIRLKPVCVDYRAQQLVGSGKNLLRVVPLHGGGSTDPVEANGWRHAT